MRPNRASSSLPGDTGFGKVAFVLWLRFTCATLKRMRLEERVESPLQQVQDLLDLNTAELGRLFGMSRQAAAQWLARGVPAARQVQVSTALAASELLQRKLKAGRLPAAARKSAEAYGGLSMLQMIESGQEQKLLDKIRASFDWSAAI